MPGCHSLDTHAPCSAQHRLPLDHFLLTAADSMLMGAMHSVLHTLPTDPGYGYYRPNVRLFDPGWNGLKVKGSEDESTGDNGNDPLGVISR